MDYGVGRERPEASVRKHLKTGACRHVHLAEHHNRSRHMTAAPFIYKNIEKTALHAVSTPTLGPLTGPFEAPFEHA